MAEFGILGLGIVLLSFSTRDRLKKLSENVIDLKYRLNAAERRLQTLLEEMEGDEK